MALASSSLLEVLPASSSDSSALIIAFHADTKSSCTSIIVAPITSFTIDHLTSNNDESFPKEYKLYQNHPNPFNPSTKIKYSVPQISNVVIKVFDILGNEMETLVNEQHDKIDDARTRHSKGRISEVDMKRRIKTAERKITAIEKHK